MRSLPRLRLAWAVMAVLAMPTGCGPTAPSTATPPALTGVTLAPANPNLPVGQSELLVATATYADGSTADVTTQATWSSNTPAVASVNSGIVSGHTEGRTTITATFGGMAGSMDLTVTPAPPENEPVGFTPLAEHYFNSVFNTDGAGFGRWSGNGRLSIVSDPTAPKSPPNVGMWTYPAGFQAGSSPGSIDFNDLGNSTQVYVRFWMKLSSGFQGQSSGTNKVLYVWINDHPAVFLDNHGTGTTASLMPIMRYQGDVDTRAYFYQNVGASQPMNRGQWRKWELLLIANTPGQANGVIRWWIDGQQVGEYTDVGFRNSAISFQYLFLQPIWGGTSGQVAATQYLWIDHLYISGLQ